MTLLMHGIITIDNVIDMLKVGHSLEEGNDYILLPAKRFHVAS